MEKFTIENEIAVFCVTAKSFPEGIDDAHSQLRTHAPEKEGRTYYGISRPQGDEGIVYKAAATEVTPGELSKQDLERFVIPKGDYFMIVIKDYANNLGAIGAAFEKIIADPSIDPNGFCLEWYINDSELRCLVRINDSMS